MNLKELKGTERQIKYANDIRKYVLFQIENSDIDKDNKEKFISALERQGNAKFIIDCFAQHFKFKNVRATVLDYFKNNNLDKITQKELKLFKCTLPSTSNFEKDLELFDSDYEEKAKAVAKASKQIERYLVYIKENINSYWYKNGEKTVTEGIEVLKENGIDATKYENALDNLKKEFETLKEDKVAKEVKVEREETAKETVKEYDKVFTDDYDAFGEGMLIVENDRVYKIVKVKREYIKCDGWSFGLCADKGYLYEGYAVDVTETDEGQNKLESCIKEESAKAKRKEVTKEYNDLISDIKENGVYCEVNEIKIDNVTTLIDNCNPKGSGYKLLQNGNTLYLMLQNGMDGDDWSKNNFGSYMVFKYKVKEQDIEKINKYIEINK